MNQFRLEVIAFLGAIRFFTRIPIPDSVPHSPEGLNHSARYFPAVGILVGLLSAIVFGLANLLYPEPVCIVIAMAASIYLTGAFHEDGLSDMADGLGGSGVAAVVGRGSGAELACEAIGAQKRAR